MVEVTISRVAVGTADRRRVVLIPNSGKREVGVGSGRRETETASADECRRRVDRVRWGGRWKMETKDCDE